MTRLRVVQPPETTDIFSREEEASKFKVSLAVMAIAEQYINQEGERKLGLNLEFFSVFGKLTALLPRGEPALVYAFNYEKAKEEALRELVLEGSNVSGRTENPEGIMLKNWIEKNVPNRYLLLGNASRRFADPYSIIDLRKHRTKLLEVSHGKYFSLHPELRSMMTDEEWQRQEAQKGQLQLRRIEHEAEPPKKPPEEILKLDEVQMAKLTWMVQLFREGRKKDLGDVKTARVRLLSRGLPVFYKRADEVASLFYDEVSEDLERSLTIEEFRALKAISAGINERMNKEQRRAKKQTV